MKAIVLLKKANKACKGVKGRRKNALCRKRWFARHKGHPRRAVKGYRRRCKKCGGYKRSRRARKSHRRSRR